MNLIEEIKKGLDENPDANYIAYYRPTIVKLLHEYTENQAQLKQHSVSGKRPFECPNCHATLQEVEMTNSDIIDALAACASGAVDTVAEEEDWDKNIKPIPTAEYKLTIGKIEKIERGASGKGQP